MDSSSTTDRPTSRDGSRTHRNRVALRILACVLAISTLVPLWSSPHVVSQNGPQYVYFSQIVSGLLTGDAHMQQWYQWQPVVVPNVLVSLVIAGLSSLISPILAWKLMLSLGVLALPFSIWRLLRVIAPQQSWLALFGFLQANNYYVFKGYDAYLLSIPLALLLLSYAYPRVTHLRWRDACMVGFGLLLVYLTHIFSFMVLCLLLPALLVREGTGRREAVRLLTAMLPAVALFLSFLVSILTEPDELVAGEKTSWLRWSLPDLTVTYFLEMNMYSISKPAVGWFLIGAGSIYVLFGLTSWRACLGCVGKVVSWRRCLSDQWALWIALGLILAYFVAPREIAGWPKYNERLLPFIFAFMLASVRLPSRRWVRPALLGVVSVCGLALCVVFVHQVRKQQNLYEEYLSGLEQVVESQPLLAIHTSQTQICRIQPIRWAYNYYSILKGCETGYSVVHYAGRVPVAYREGVRDRLRQFQVDSEGVPVSQSIADEFASVLHWGRDAWVDHIVRESGFRKVHQQGRLTIYRREPELTDVVP